MKKILVAVILIAIVFSCSSKQKTTDIEKKNTDEVAIEQTIPVENGFIASYAVVKERDLSLGSAIRKEFRVTLPEKLKKEDIINNFRVLAISEYNKNKYNAITIFAFHEAESVDQAYTIAMYEFCPYGDWGRSLEKTPISEFKENIEFKKKYFEGTSEKWGVPFKKRNIIRNELSELQVKATEDADKKYPLTSRSITKADIKRNDKYRAKILKEYKSQLAKKHKISDAVLDSILWENVFD